MKRFILIPILLLSSIIGGYYAWWHYGAVQMEEVALDWISTAHDKGYQIYHGTPKVEGFPLSLTMTFPAPLVEAPDGNFTYKGDALTLETLPWNPTIYRLQIIGAQSVEVNNGDISDVFNIKTGSALAITKIDFEGQLKRLDITIADLDITAQNSKEKFSTRDLSLTIALPDDEPSKGKNKPLTIQLISNQITLPKSFKSPLKSTIRHFSTRFIISGPLTSDLSLQALTKWQQAGGEINILDLSLNWDDLQLKGNGQVALDDQLYLFATLDSQIAGLGDTMLAFANKGLIDARIAKISAMGFKLLAKKPDNDSRPSINIPLSTQRGELYLGPIKIANIPALTGQFYQKEPDPVAPASVGPVGIDIDLPELVDPPTVSHKNLKN